MLGKLRTEAEVGNFNRASRGKKDVVGFDIAMNDILVVKMLETFACLMFDLLAKS